MTSLAASPLVSSRSRVPSKLASTTSCSPSTASAAAARLASTLRARVSPSSDVFLLDLEPAPSKRLVLSLRPSPPPEPTSRAAPPPQTS